MCLLSVSNHENWVVNMERITIRVTGDDEELDELADFLEDGGVAFGRGMVYSDGTRKAGEEYVWETRPEILHPIGFDLNRSTVKILDAWLRKHKAGQAGQRLRLSVNDARIMALDKKALGYLNDLLDGFRRLPVSAHAGVHERRLVSLPFPL